MFGEYNLAQLYLQPLWVPYQVFNRTRLMCCRLPRTCCKAYYVLYSVWHLVHTYPVCLVFRPFSNSITIRIRRFVSSHLFAWASSVLCLSLLPDLGRSSMSLLVSCFEVHLFTFVRSPRWRCILWTISINISAHTIRPNGYVWSSNAKTL